MNSMSSGRDGFLSKRVLRLGEASGAHLLPTNKTLKFETKESFLRFAPIGQKGGLSLNTLNKFARLPDLT